MSLVYAAVVPHAPLLVPAIAKKNAALLDQTRQQLNCLAQECYAVQPDVLIVITPHGPVIGENIVAMLADEHRGSFRDFGDIQTKVRLPGAVGFTHRLKERAAAEHIMMLLQTVSELDYGSAIPLLFLLPHQPRPRVLPLAVSSECRGQLVRFGHVLYDFIQQQPERVALIASADLSRDHPTTVTARNHTAEERRFSQALTKLEIGPLEDQRNDPRTCGLIPLLLFIVTLQSVRAKAKIHTMEAPFAVGQMTVSYKFGS